MGDVTGQKNISNELLQSRLFCFSLDDNKPIWMHAEEREESKVR